MPPDEIDFTITTIGGQVVDFEGDLPVNLTLIDRSAGTEQHATVMLSQLVSGAIQTAQRNDAMNALRN